MRIDVVTIFPDYLAPLRLSLPGRAIRHGLVEFAVHDLRRWTDDRHRTVDDTPYGGGAGMVMTPEPWGRALDALVAPGDDARLVLLTPSGRVFDQTLAAELAAEEHLVLACGRYEGLDARVAAYARSRMRVSEVSVGDYVLNGGEAGALVVLEAVIRLLPGVIGNPASLYEESHAPGHGGLLEYPSYTKPPVWRGLAVPAVLFSGHHAHIAAWRAEQALRLTRERRPDLLPGPARTDELVLAPAGPSDAGELLTVQRAAFVTEAQANGSTDFPPLTESVSDLAAALSDHLVLVARSGPRLVGGVRGVATGEDTWTIQRLVVAPDRQGEGIGSLLFAAIQTAAPPGTRRLRLVTGAASVSNLRFYASRGYAETDRTSTTSGIELVVLERVLAQDPRARLEPR